MGKMTLDTAQQGGLFLTPSQQKQGQRKLWLCAHEALEFEEAQNLLKTRDSRKTCGRASCRNTFTHILMTHKRGAAGGGTLQLITSVNLFDIPCLENPEQACQLYCSQERIATVLNGLDFPMCPHLKLSSNFLLTQLNVQSTRILEPNTYVDRCKCHTPSHSNLPCRHSSHCFICFSPSHNAKTAFNLQPTKVTRHGEPQHLNIRLNISRNLGILQSPTDPAWLTHTSSSLDLHNMASAWQHWDSNFLTLLHLRRNWLHDLIPCHQKINGELLDGRRAHTLADWTLKHRSSSQNGRPATLIEVFRQQREWYQTRKLLDWAVKEQFRELATQPDTDRLRLSFGKFGLWRTLEVLWQEERQLWVDILRERQLREKTERV